MGNLVINISNFFYFDIKADACIPGDIVFLSGTIKTCETPSNLNKFGPESNILQVYLDVKNVLNIKEYYYSKYRKNALENDEESIDALNYSTRFLRDEIDIFNDIGSNEDLVLKLLVK